MKQLEKWERIAVGRTGQKRATSYKTLTKKRRKQIQGKKKQERGK
jgi:hypothetical protein